jgi:hypothetical protein
MAQAALEPNVSELSITDPLNSEFGAALRIFMLGWIFAKGVSVAGVQPGVVARNPPAKKLYCPTGRPQLDRHFCIAQHLSEHDTVTMRLLPRVQAHSDGCPSSFRSQVEVNRSSITLQVAPTRVPLISRFTLYLKN